MTGYQPKVGDRVKLGEHGPYRVCATYADRGRTLIGAAGDETWVKSIWLTPAPEPEPELPTERGALIVDGAGRHRFLYVSELGFLRWIATDGPAVDVKLPADLPRPITVILADPAEVETLRQHLRHAENDRDVYKDERDQAHTTLENAGNEITRLGAELETHREAAAHTAVTASRADNLQTRLDAARRIIEHPGNWSTYSHLRARLQAAIDLGVVDE